MIKYFTMLALGLVLGCSSGAKKQATTTPTPTPAPVAPPADSKGTPVDVKLEAAAKKGKKAKATKADAVSDKGDVTCQSGKDVRKIAVKGKGKGCELEYTKAGQATAVASQIIGQAKCDEVSTKIQEKLTAAGYKCE